MEGKFRGIALYSFYSMKEKHDINITSTFRREHATRHGNLTDSCKNLR